MPNETTPEPARPRQPWWTAIGPALIIACVVFGPGSLIVSTKVGATFGCDFLWVLVLTGTFMGTYVAMSAKIGVVGEATPLTLLARTLGNPARVLVGITLCLVCATFQFSNNTAFAMAVGAFVPKSMANSLLLVQILSLIVINGLIVVFLFAARHVYTVVERGMKFMVAVVLISFVSSMVLSGPNLFEVLWGFVPNWPEGFAFGEVKKPDGALWVPMGLIAAMLGTTFSVGGAFFQGNLVRERGWSIADYHGSIRDSIAGVCVLTGVSMVIMITAATVLPGKTADNIGELAVVLEPALGPTAYWIFCIGLIPIAMNPFMINALIGGAILSDAVGKPCKLSDPLPRKMTIAVLLLGMGIAIWGLSAGRKPAELIVFGQALTVLGNPLMAAAILFLANRADIMGKYRNSVAVNIVGILGFLVVLFVAANTLSGVITRVARGLG